MIFEYFVLAAIYVKIKLREVVKVLEFHLM